MGQLMQGGGRGGGGRLPDSRGRFVGVQSVPWAVSVDVTPADGQSQDERYTQRNDLLPLPTACWRENLGNNNIMMKTRGSTVTKAEDATFRDLRILVGHETGNEGQILFITLQV